MLPGLIDIRIAKFKASRHFVLSDTDVDEARRQRHLNIAMADFTNEHMISDIRSESSPDVLPDFQGDLYSEDDVPQLECARRIVWHVPNEVYIRAT